jgi:hypothetical protein
MGKTLLGRWSWARFDGARSPFQVLVVIKEPHTTATG